MAVHLPVVRVTVLGDEGAGKTSLVSAFVNNFCPTMHDMTKCPVLYYKTLEVPGSDQRSGEETRRPAVRPLLAEIEDTAPWDRMAGHLKFKGTWVCKNCDTFNFPCIAKEKGREKCANDECQKNKDAKKEISHSRAFEHVEGHLGPFSQVKAPILRTTDSKDTKDKVFKVVAPVTRCLGVLVVFDSAKEESWQGALEKVKLLRACWPEGENPPVIYLVANKIDIVDPPKQDEQFLKEYDVKWGAVSAFELQKVRRLFRSFLRDVSAKEEEQRKELSASGLLMAGMAGMATSLSAGVAGLGGGSKSSRAGSNSSRDDVGSKQPVDPERATQQQSDNKDCNVQ